MDSKILSRLNIDPGILIILALLLGAAAVILAIALMVRQSRLEINYKIFMRGKNGKSLENSFQQHFDELDLLHEQSELINKRMTYIEKSYNKSYTKVGIIKYDAFKELGGNLSFALTLLNDANTGFVLNCIHSREGSYTYIKNIIKGDSELPLSEEEAKSVETAMYSLSNIPGADAESGLSSEALKHSLKEKLGKAAAEVKLPDVKLPETKNTTGSETPDGQEKKRTGFLRRNK